MRTALCLALFVASLASAQAPAPTVAKPVAASQPTAPAKPVPQGTITITVVEKGSNRPIEQALVTLLNSNGSQIQNLTNVDGMFQMKVPPGSYRITVRPRSQTGYIGAPAVGTTIVRLDEEAKETIQIAPASEISGRVLDSRGEPVLGARVTLFIRNYEIWSPNIIYGNTPLNAQTNDLGEFTIGGVPAGMGFHLYAEVITPNSAEAAALTAADPDLRRPILAGTFYPRTIDASASAPVTLSEGQRLENIEVRMVQSKSYCVHSAALPVPAGDLQYSISVDRAQFASVVFNGYGSFRTGRSAQLDKDGNAHICGLWPGTYKFTVQSNQFRTPHPNNWAGFGEFTISDRDITSLSIKGSPMFDIPGEVVIDGPPPAEPVTNRITFGFGNVTPTSVATSEQVDIPGKFTLKNLHYDRELIQYNTLPGSWYVKSVMLGDEDLTLKAGRFVLDKNDVPMKVVLSPRGSRIKIKVTDAKGEPVVGHRVILIPRRLSDAPSLASQLWSSYSDVNGECSAFTLPNEPPKVTFAPGEYTVIAVETPFNMDVASHDQLWRALQTEGKRLVLEPEKTTEISLRPTVLP